jgi:transposase
MKEVSVIGLDIAKDVFQAHGNDASGRMLFSKKLRRVEVLPFFRSIGPCLVGIEACGGSQYWAKSLGLIGHTVKLIPAQYVKPYVKTNKNDAADAEAIAEAVTRPNMRFASQKQSWQQDIQILHRARTRLVRTRTALCNEIRSFLHEHGIIAPKGQATLRKRTLFLLAEVPEDSSLSSEFRQVLEDLIEELVKLDQRISQYDRWIQTVAKATEICQRLEKIEGIGLITATALAASVGNAADFKNGRQFAAWIGLVPRQYSSGGKSNLLGISKRGNPHLRSLLIHGARAVANHSIKRSDSRSQWLNEKIKTRGFNRAIVAFANKNARIVWAMMARDEEYRMAS